MLERETSREKNLEKAQKEAKARARKEAGKSVYQAAPPAGGSATAEADEIEQARGPPPPCV
jgi:hypothetical protein